ncbi:MAG: molybdenum cofactor synthesis domain protein [Phycisphaerales bacterium]|jgi:molybdenum cofactor biosynthesis protein B|nr:molybdenum cofactor synthesis domain protein [Phycisphaerales bacterium]
MAYEQHIQAAKEIVARCAVVTLSDTRTPATDTSGQLIQKLLTDGGHRIAAYHLIKDDPEVLESLLLELASNSDVDALLTNGGTGIARRDQTIEMIERMIDQPLPGFGELFRMLSWQQIGAGAMLSRAVAGITRGKPIFAMPGSSKAVELAMTQLILPQLRHILHELRK